MASVTMPAARVARVLRVPTALTGFWSWFTTVDHKKIGILYGVDGVRRSSSSAGSRRC